MTFENILRFWTMSYPKRYPWISLTQQHADGVHNGSGCVGIPDRAAIGNRLLTVWNGMWCWELAYGIDSELLQQGNTEEIRYYKNIGFDQ
jgi:hypothetical protein